MGWSADTEGNLATLKRIVALLFSLAALADDASRSSRREMLLHIRRAHLAAWSLTLEDAYDLYADPELIAETFEWGDSSTDAAHLAVVLRALALILALRFQLYRSLPGKSAGCFRTDTVLLRNLQFMALAMPGSGGIGEAARPQAIPP